MEQSLAKLVAHINESIDERKFCRVFDNTLSEHWPRKPDPQDEQAKAIRAFAKSQGWSVTIMQRGLTATFKKLPEA
jgi:hypothetical protein